MSSYQVEEKSINGKRENKYRFILTKKDVLVFEML